MRGHHLPSRMRSAAGMFALVVGSALLSPAIATEPAPAVSTQPGGEDMSSVLQILLTTPERRALAAEVAGSIRAGDLKGAEQRLNGAIEMGALAIVLVDRLQEPGLLSAFQALGLQAPPPPPAETDMANLAALREALEREKARGDAAERQFASLADEYRTLQEDNALSTKSLARLTELKDRLNEEHARANAATESLAALQKEIQVLQARKEEDAAAHEARIAGLQEALMHEVLKRDTAARELAGLREELRVARTSQEQASIPPVAQLKAEAAPAPISDMDQKQPPAGPQLLLATGAANPPQVSLASTLPLAEAAGTSSSLSVQAPAEPPKANPPPVTGSIRTESSAAAEADDRLTTRAEALFRQGDVSGARLLLERSAQAGGARATFLLAETFDPHILSRIGARGLRGDEAKARELYAKAQALGVAQAGERLQSLGRTSKP